MGYSFLSLLSPKGTSVFEFSNIVRTTLHNKQDSLICLCSFLSLLDKLLVSCPNADSCQEQVQRGNLDDHLRYRCSGTLVACQFAASGCDYRGPSKSMAKHQTECRFKKEGKNFLKTFFFLAVEVPEVVYYHTMWPYWRIQGFWKVKVSHKFWSESLEGKGWNWPRGTLIDLIVPSFSSFCCLLPICEKNLLRAVLLHTRLFFLTKKEWRGS